MNSSIFWGKEPCSLLKLTFLAYSSTLKIEVACSSETTLAFNIKHGVVLQKKKLPCYFHSLRIKNFPQNFVLGEPVYIPPLMWDNKFHTRTELIKLLFYILIFSFVKSRESVVGIAIGYELDDQEVRVRAPIEAIIFTSACRPNRFCGPPSVLSNEHREHFLWGKAAGA
jgi:hypothetical protein